MQANHLRGTIAAALLTLSVAVPASAAQVLVVLSDADHLDLKDGKRYDTGFYLNELLVPVKMLLDAGHQVTFATPLGRAPAVDKSSLDAQYFGGDTAALAAYRALLEQLALTSAERSPVVSLARVEQQGYGRYDAVYVPGGHAPMQDLIRSPQLGRLLADFHARGRTTALVCHGPAALLSTLDPAFVARLEAGQPAARPKWLYAGYRMTVISNAEEEQAKALLDGGAMKLLPQTGLQKAGADYRSNAQPWTPYVVQDRELITGQNPASAGEVGRLLLLRLTDATN
ncbi:type 1 glutamine amidotransferase domain-containing protein [Pseudoduganella chitinolytica]|uniref:Type 1 glutamine amidotransferase domain-containing protein n=1 Tax=Pseudoduganella chitinolytica TaxID=34070 RepID=A0ABY8B8D5_9BURK|nr:type 1 glutamine amidotransferase domain-containing protein [Pseudoduganella chitinolytica]WEF32165.1 type 1 glutamine amidotransferase domain-containing protein [Pseudoduganella chitinolytica]